MRCTFCASETDENICNVCKLRKNEEIELLIIAKYMVKDMERFNADRMSYKLKNIKSLPGYSVEIVVKETRKK